MAYPFSYQPSYYPLFQPQQPQTNITWVQGIEGAKAYPVGAGNTMILLDSESSLMFIKSSDQSGLPTLRVFDYKERTAEEQKEVPVYVTKKEFDEFVAKMKPKKKKVEDDDDE